tara:strand:+ start:305 stop:1024 length:720 start_codon:yes stop_codon:yes gene_type:complete
MTYPYNPYSAHDMVEVNLRRLALQELTAMGEDTAFMDRLQSSDRVLIEVARHSHRKVLKKLLQNGADPNVRNAQRETALMVAAKKNLGTICRMLVRFGANIDLHGPKQDAAIYHAMRYGHQALVWKFLEWGADPYIKTSASGATMLMVAVKYMDLEFIRHLVENLGMDVNAVDKEGYSVLMIAADHNTGTSKVEYLLEKEADPYFTDPRSGHRKAIDIANESSNYAVRSILYHHMKPHV